MTGHRHEEKHREKTVEDGGMQAQAKEHQEPSEVERGHKGLSPKVFGKGVTLTTLRF